MPPAALADALTSCDMTTGPDGQAMTVTARLAEIRGRYGPGHPVTGAITTSAADITAAAERTAARLAGTTSPHTAEPPPRLPEHSPAGCA